MPHIDVALLPEHVSPERIRSDALIVVDVLRASTTIVAAFESGARSIQPVLSVEDALELATKLPDALLCGERHGLPPDGFDLGNSPLGYKSCVVQNRDLILTTTNGTRALSMLSESQRVCIGSLTNRSSVCEAVSLKDTTIICAGTNGHVSLDDCYVAGCIVEQIIQSGAKPTEAARLVLDASRESFRKNGTHDAVLKSTQHGRRLCNLGFEDDINNASTIDSIEIVPVYNPASQLITI
jgi:2-phosphosulfolactate phosphatase